MDADYRVIRIGRDRGPKTERQILADFVKFVQDKRPDLVTYNGRGFDLPVIASRCLKHGVPSSITFQTSDLDIDLARGHFDLMDYMSGLGAARASLSIRWQKLIGLPAKWESRARTLDRWSMPGASQRWKPIACAMWRKRPDCFFACN